MAKLNRNHKTFIVKALACYDSVSDIQHGLKTEFNIDAPLQQVSRYNPETINGQKLAQDLKLLFQATRGEYLEDVQKHEIAKKGWRLGLLQKMVEDMMNKPNPNYVLISQLLEQAAKEVGGVFEGKGNEGDSGGDTINNYIQQIYNRIENR